MNDLIVEFLALLDQPPPADTALVQKLAHLLDGLLFAMGTLPEGRQAPDMRDAPRLDQTGLQQKICALFPNFGFYPSVDPLTDLMEGAPQVGLDDAIDDLVDIVNDLTDATWRFSNTDELDAYWHLHFFYRCHWGRHLLNLRSFIHATLYEKA